jgi:hypothetical protein
MYNAGGYCPDHNGPRINDLRLWKVSDIEATIKTWLTDTPTSAASAETVKAIAMT